MKMLGSSVLTGLVSILPGNALKGIADIVLDIGENFVGATKTQVDDSILLPMLGGVRQVFNIPDNDELEANASGVLTGLVSILPDEAMGLVAKAVLEVGKEYLGDGSPEISDAVLLPMIEGVQQSFDRAA